MHPGALNERRDVDGELDGLVFVVEIGVGLLVDDGGILHILDRGIVAGRHELDLVDIDFKLGALLTLALPLAPMQLAFDGHLRALGDDVLKGFCAVAEDVSIDEVGVVFPLPCLRVASTIVDCNAER